MRVFAIDGNVINETYTRDSEGIPGVAEEDDRLGDQLAVGDFDGNGFDEIAATVRGEGIGQPPSEIENAGAVNVFDLTHSNRHQLWTQDEIPSVPQEQPEAFDRFGSALVAGTINGGTKADLIVGAPGNSISESGTGSAVVLYSAPIDSLFGDRFEDD